MGKHKEFLRGDGTVLYPNCGVSAMGSTHVVQLHRTTHTHTHTHTHMHTKSTLKNWWDLNKFCTWIILYQLPNFDNAL